MDINELETYRLSDAVKFHDRLNPALWGPGETMLPEVRDRLRVIADDFREFLGIDVEVKDITVSGSNAAYTYTPHSDIDLHLVVDLPRADESDVYRELFDAKKYAYNDQHDFKIGGYDVELYVQNANDVHHSQGIYSLVNDDWVRVPSRRKPQIDDISVESKYQDLARRIDAAIQSGDLDRMDRLAAKIRDMRQSGLDRSGEFGAENLAFKVLRNNGTLERLRDARQAAKSQSMSLDERKKKKKNRKRYGSFGGMWFPGYHYYGQTDSAADGGDGGGGESVRESRESQKDVIDRFARSCSDFLGMERAPEIRLRQDPQWSKVNGTFGRYTADPEHRIELATAGRHIVDILRTLAHEMTHARQNEVTGLPDDAGETGSEYEDSANAMAGRIMRHWADQEPEMFAGVDLDEQAAEQGTDQPAGVGALGALRAIQNIGRVARNLPTQAGAQEELSQELRNWLRRQGGQTDQPTNLPLPDIRQQQESQEVAERAAPRFYSNDQLDQIAVRYAQQYRVPIDLVRHVMQKETGGLPADLRIGARSPKGAIGVMQLMPATAAELGVDPRDPVQNIEGGVRYLRQQLDAFGNNSQLAMMAYNWGPGNVRQWRRRGSDPRRMPRETRNYIAGYQGSAPRTQVARAPEKRQAVPPSRPAPPPPPQQRATASDQQPLDRESLRQQELARIEKILQRDLGQAARPAAQDDDVVRYPRRTSPQRSAPPPPPPRRREAFEASGYIPTAAEKNDPRFSMALTVDVHPGETGRQANKLGLKTDSQGRPALLMKKLNNLLEEVKLDEDCWDGYRQQGMKKKGDRMVPNCVKVSEEEELTEVKMSPAEFQKFLKSPAAEGIRAGFEAELIFRNTQSDPEGGGEAEPDYEADERAYDIDDIINFFTGGENPMSMRAAQRLSQELTEQFSDWAREQFANDYFDQDRFMSWAEENVWPDNEDHYREDARANLDDDATDEDVEREAVSLFRDDVERDWDRSGAWYDMASEELFDEYWGDLDQSDWLDQQGLNFMSNVAEEYNLDWPYWTDGSGSGGERDWNDISNSLATVTGMPVRVSGGYHGAARRPGQYIIEPDSSLTSDDSDDYGLEVVSPPMPLPEAVEQLRRIIDWANGPGDAYTNSSTGLHMGVSLPFKGGDVDPIKLILFMGDRNLLETFGRESNTYARSAYERLESKIRGMRNAGPKQIAGVMELMKKNLIELADREMKRGLLGDKYVSVHPQDGYIEFRGPGGDYLAKQDEIDGVLENTMLRLAYAMSIAGSPDLYRKEYAKKLYKVLTKDDPANPFMQLFADYSAGTLTGEQLKRQWADTVLQAERGDVEDVPNAVPGEYEVYDKDSGTPGDRDSFTVIDTFQSNSDENALVIAQEKWSGRGVNFGVRARVAEPEEQKPKSRRAELAQRVTRSTKDVGEQLWRVNHHSSVRWVTARSQADAVKQAIQQDRAFNSAETRARIATDLEKAQWNLEQERQRERDAGRDAAEIRARLGVPVPAGGSEEKTYRVTWTERRSDGERQDSLNVQARGPQNAMQRIRDALDAQGREVVRIEADEVAAPARDGEPIPGSTLDLARQRAQQAQGEWTGHWIVRDSQGRELTRFHGIGNAQSDANRHAAAWLGRNRPDLVGQDVDVVPEMT